MHVQPSRYIHYIQDYIFFFSLFTFAFLSFNEYSWDKNLLPLNLSLYVRLLPLFGLSKLELNDATAPATVIFTIF